MENYWGISDIFGAVTFKNLKIKRGPEGLYSFKVVTRNYERIESSEFDIFFFT